MARPTISLAMICKNELHNIPRLFKSIEGCFDEICIADTGSTDGTVEFINKMRESGEDLKQLGCKIVLTHFEWIKDFSAARNFSFQSVTSDYVVWLDFDDCLFNKENFILWRDNSMAFADYWIANYHYALHADGSPAITFSRERVFKRSKGATWNYFVHEGVVPKPNTRCNFIGSWAVKHHRTEDDIKLDKGRNLDIFTHWVAKDPSKICHRMKYYWGKELFEADKPLEAFPKLMESIADPKLEHHDRILGIQYAALAAMKCNQMEKAIQIAHQGLQLEPTRAEYYVIIADCYVKLNKLSESIPFYEAARASLNKGSHVNPAAIFSHDEAYGLYPTNQLARVRYHLQDFEGALKEAQASVVKWNSHESKEMVKEILKGIEATKVSDEAIQTEDIVITTPPTNAYEWDESKYKVKAMGGSETAAIEMASWLKKLTGRSVKIFNMRESDLVAPSGVEYLQVKNINAYFSKYKPKVHIAWRHNTKLTTAPTYLWCHDLTTPAAEMTHLYDKIMCLTPFHSRHVQAMQGIPSDKIMITRNGLNVGRFRGINAPRNPNKIVFPSSPDRGLKEAMLVCDEVIKSHPSIELHVFYGIEHLHKYGLQKMADELKAMMESRPYVKYHGATEQNDLAMHLKGSAIWLHPCDFIETSCITAMEMLVCGVYPVTRRLGGLMDTLAEAEKNGMATLLDVDPAEDLTPYIVETKRALDEKLWEKVDVNPESYSWECVAKEWIQAMGLGSDNVTV